MVQQLVDARPPVRDEAAYAALVADAGDQESAVRALLPDLLRTLEGWREADKLLSGRAEMTMLPALSDMKAQLARLVHAGFVSEAGAEQLRRLPVYLAALVQRRRRLDEGGGAVNRDRAQLDKVTELQEAYLHQVDALPAGPAAGRAAAPGAVDARGVPRLPVGPAARHRLPRQRPADPQGPGLTDGACPPT